MVLPVPAVCLEVRFILFALFSRVRKTSLLVTTYVGVRANDDGPRAARSPKTIRRVLYTSRRPSLDWNPIQPFRYDDNATTLRNGKANGDDFYTPVNGSSPAA
jgi:hypothetical protein